MSRKGMFWIRTILCMMLFAAISFGMPEMTANAAESTDPATIYLSDLTETSVTTGYGSLCKDTNLNGGTISVMVNGQRTYFEKGICAHATSTVIYDLGDYVGTYPYFSAKIGVDASQGGKGEVSFIIYGSNDNSTWTALAELDAVTSGDDAHEVYMSLEGYQYVKLYADMCSGNGNDHAVYADARLVQAPWDGIKTVEQYDTELAANSYDTNYSDNLHTVLEREFTNRMGYLNLQLAVNDSSTMKNTLAWLLDENTDTLQLFIEAGNICDSSRTLEALDQLYQAYSGIISNDTTTDGYIYKKMLLALAVVYGESSESAIAFNEHDPKYNVVQRFADFRCLYDGNTVLYTMEDGTEIAGEFQDKELFKTYQMELLRMTLNVYLQDNELLWLRAYAENRYPDMTARLNFGNYVAYGDCDLTVATHPAFYNTDNAGEYNAEYLLDSFDIEVGADEIARTWMLIETQGKCWSQSRFGQTLYKIHGVPAAGAYQTTHEPYFVYTENENGDGIWNLMYSGTDGWGCAYTDWYDNQFRMLFNWGSGTSYSQTTSWNESDGTKVGGNSASYLLLGQAALNDYTNYMNSFYYNLIADAYDDIATKKAIYLQSLSSCNLNLDSYLDLIELYKADEATTEEEWMVLADAIIEAYTYYPAAMTDLLREVKTYLSSSQAAAYGIKENSALLLAEAATSEVSLQPEACQTIAAQILGTERGEFATFSFDTGEITISDEYTAVQMFILYSVDGGTTWSEAQEAPTITVSAEDLEQITVENDLKICVEGIRDEIYTIDILDGESIEGKAAASDYENIVVVSSDTYLNSLQYSTDGTTWADYESSIKFEGEQTVYVRLKAHDVYVSGASMALSFTEHDSQGGTFEYIPISQLSYVSSNASQSGQEPEHMLDANSFTVWHTTWGVQATDMSYVMNFVDENGYATVKQFSGFTYEGPGGNGTIKYFTVYTSPDGENWTEVGSNTSSAWGNGVQTETFKLEESVATVYVKIEATETYTNSMFVSGLNFNFFEDITVTPCVAHTDADADNTCDVCNMDLCMTAGTDVEAYSLTLQGDIGVNFHMSLTADVLALAAEDLVYMHFILPGEEQTDLYVPFEETNYIKKTDEDGNECIYYTFSCDVNAREMTQDIQAALFVNGIRGVGYTYSIKDYADYIRENSSKFSDETVALATAMLNYGAAAQERFSYMTDNLANADLTDEEKAQVDLVTAAKTTADSGETTYTINYESGETVAAKITSGACAGTLTGIEYYGTSTLGKTETTLRHYFVLESGADIAAYSAQYGDTALTFKHENTNIYYVDIENIPADQFENGYAVTIGSSTETDAGLTLTYSVYDYIGRVLTESYFTASMKNVARAMYLYGVAAEGYEASLVTE